LGPWPAALLLEGEAGIGKTALWETALSAGDFRGRVLRAHPAEAEIKLSFTGLGITLALAALAAGPPVVSAISATLFTSGTLTERVNVNNDRIRFKTKDPTDVHVQEVRFAPGASSTDTTIPALR
jgi:hypothetical protein